MESPLKKTIGALAARFAEEVVKAISSLLAETLAMESRRVAAPAARPRRAPSRPPRPLEEFIEEVSREVARHAEGTRAEDLRRALDYTRGQMTTAVRAALAAGRITKTGKLRRTTYFIVGSKAPATKSKKAAARRAKSGASRAKPDKTA